MCVCVWGGANKNLHCDEVGLWTTHSQSSHLCSGVLGGWIVHITKVVEDIVLGTSH